MKNSKVLIAGAGLAGLSTAYFLQEKGIEPFVFEKEQEPGGLCRSIKKHGFTFDYSGHLLHFREKQTLSLVKSLLPDNLIKHQRNAWVYSFDKFLPYPFQANFSSLPENIAKECFSGFMRAKAGKENPLVNNFLDWSKATFGPGITKCFMAPYNEKFWNTSLENLAFDWAVRFVAVPSAEDVDKNEPGNLGYNAFFWYPKTGGIEELIKAFCAGNENIYLNHGIQSIDLKEKTIEFENSRKMSFDVLISTIPLPELGKAIKDLKPQIEAEFKKLRWLSIYNLNLGIKGNTCPRRHWIYFPGREVNFFRVGFFHNFSDYLAPQDASSLYAETSYKGGGSFNREAAAKDIISGLKKAGIISCDSQILTEQVNDIKYGYPVYDFNYKEARTAIVSYLADNGVIACGRFGGWQYLSMEDVIIEAKTISESVELEQMIYA